MLKNKILSAVSGQGEKLYSDDVFSTYLYTGNGSTQTINNGIDLAGKGGLVWLKNRTSSTVSQHSLFDTIRGTDTILNTASTLGAQAGFSTIFGFHGSGFNVGATTYFNENGIPAASWTFRKAPKFFDIVTYTGNGVAGREIPHGLGCEPGMIVVKRTDTTSDWFVYHVGAGAGKRGLLNSTAMISGSTVWNSTAPTSSLFFVNADTNLSGGTYVAYLFAHDPSADGIIQCGSYVGNDSTTGPTVALGWEPQYVLIKGITTAAASSTGPWTIFDNMRGMDESGSSNTLRANQADSEIRNANPSMKPTASGFQITSGNSTVNSLNHTYIYMAIRRPNKPPKTGTEVYNAITRAGTGAAATVTGVGFPVDLAMIANRTSVSTNKFVTIDRLRGSPYFVTCLTDAETANNAVIQTNPFDVQDGFDVGTTSGLTNSASIINYAFRRAPGFFDVVCYTGTGVARTVNHSLGVAPELVIFKARTASSKWPVWITSSGATGFYPYLNESSAVMNEGSALLTTSPTDLSLSLSAVMNESGRTFVAYLFATLPGISKVGSYTGNGSNQTINCGFTTGARFILIKRTDAAGDWYVWDSARGIVAANDPHLSLNTTTAEVTTDDSVDPGASGFIVNQVAATNINVSGGSYIFLAIA